jgi:hypothetical protein
MAKLNRRSLGLGALGAALGGRRTATAQFDPIAFSYPVGDPGRTIGDGFWPRHGYACENTLYYPGLWHTGENWYRIEDGDTAGAPVLAAADGTIVFAGFDYPGPVVIIRHADDLYSMYGHLDYELAIAEGDAVKRGQRIGTVLNRTDEIGRSHVHFEFRTFLFNPDVNGPSPRYNFTCGPNCAPGPGYWPMNAPDHPSAVGWRNPVHVIAKRMFGGGPPPAGSGVIVAEGADSEIELWSEPSDHTDARSLGRHAMTPGDRFTLLSVATGAEASEGTSAEAYRLWYRLWLPEGDRVWVQAAVPSDYDRGSDGRPTSVRLLFFPDTAPRSGS